MISKSILFALLASSPAFAGLVQSNPPVPSKDAPDLVWDLDASITKGYRNFRTTNDAITPKEGATAPSTAGLAALHESGSSEFSSKGLKSMMKKFSGPVTVFDLRQEDHGFINDLPVSWFATNNWANVDKPHDVIVAEEKARFVVLTPGAKVAVTTDKAKKGDPDTAAAPAAPAAAVPDLSIASAETEGQLVNAAGAHYVRLTVTDHCRPTDAEVDAFVAAVRALPADGWAHFHCRAGRGRTTTFMALYDMLRNAQNVSLLDIVQRQSLLAGDYDLLGKESEPGAKAGVAADRAAFVRAFYDYAKANPNGQPQLWSAWLKSQP